MKAGNTGTTVESWITRSGAASGNNAAEALEQAIAIAEGNGGTVANIEKLLNVANGNAAEFERLVNAAPRFQRVAPVPNPQPGNLAPELTSTNTYHFLDRHTYLYFAFQPQNLTASTTGFWPVGTDEAQLIRWVEDAIAHVRANGSFPAPDPVTGNYANGPITSLSGVPTSGGNVTIGFRGDGTSNLIVGQFYPEGVETFSRQALKAFKSLFNL